MSLEVRQGTLTCPAATGAQVTSFGSAMSATPAAIIFWASARTAAGTGASASYSLGFASGTSTANQSVSGSYIGDALSTSFAVRSMAQGVLFVPRTTSAGAEQVVATLTAWDSSGFTLTYTNVTSGAIIHYLALGGSDVTNAVVGQFSTTTATGNVAHTGLTSFMPNVLLCASTGGTSNAVGSSNTGLGLGCAVSATQRWATSLQAVGGQTMSANQFAKHYFRSDRCLLQLNPATSAAVLNEADFVSFSATGWTLNYTTNGASTLVGFLALAVTNAGAGVATHTASEASGSVSSLAYTPAAVLFGTGSSSVSTSVAAGAYQAVGASDGTVAGLVAVAQQDATVATAADTDMQTTKAIESFTEASTLPIVVSQMGVPTFTGTGFSYAWANTTAAVFDFGWLALGGAVAAAQDTPELRGRPFGLLGQSQMHQLLAQ